MFFCAFPLTGVSLFHTHSPYISRFLWFSFFNHNVGSRDTPNIFLKFFYVTTINQTLFDVLFIYYFPRKCPDLQYYYVCTYSRYNIIYIRYDRSTPRHYVLLLLLPTSIIRLAYRSYNVITTNDKLED